MDLDGLTGEILPALIARLRASRLAELEVRSDGWRVRLRRDLRDAPRRRGRGRRRRAPERGRRLPAAADAARPRWATSAPLRGLAVGQLVPAGDPLGSVDVLGIDQDVTGARRGPRRAPSQAEPGQAVEYGQVLVEIDPLADA